jgi:hypothetical protein
MLMVDHIRMRVLWSLKVRVVVGRIAMAMRYIFRILRRPHRRRAGKA